MLRDKGFVVRSEGCERSKGKQRISRRYGQVAEQYLPNNKIDPSYRTVQYNAVPVMYCTVQGFALCSVNTVHYIDYSTTVQYCCLCCTPRG